jgi:PAS domain S-box-containing protein
MSEINNKTILLVEDEAVIALSEKKALEKYGYDVITVLSGEDAIDISRQILNLDLILMDIDLGKGIDGSQTAQIILEKRDLPVVFLSSHIEPQVVEKTEKITSYGYILKNSSITVLDASIKMAFKLFEANKKLADEKEHLSTTLNSIGDAVIVTDIMCNITRMNPVAEKLTGWTINEADGLPIDAIFKIINADSRLAVDNPVEKVLHNGRIVGLANHTVLISKNEAEYQIADSGSPIINSSGEITGVVLVFRDVTEEYKLQKTLQEKDKILSASNEMLQTILDSIPQFICWKNKKSEFLGCNKNFLKIVGLPDMQSLIGKTDWDLPWKKEETEQFLRDDFEVMESNVPKYHIIEQAFDANKRETWHDTNKVPLHDSEGNVNGILIAFSDITEREQALEELAHDQYLLQALLSTSSDRIYFKDNENKFIKASMAQAKLFGLSDPVEMIGKTDFDYFSEEHAKQAYEDEKMIIETGRSLRKEEKETWEGQPDTWVITEKMPLHDNEGNIIGTFGISKDITDRKHAEQELVQEQYLLQILMDTTPDIIYFKDKECRFLRTSKSQLGKFGISDQSELLGKTDFDFFTKEHAQQAYEDEQELMRTGEILMTEEKETWPNKSDTWAYTIKLPIKGKDGGIVGTFGISRDITKIKNTEEKIENLLKEKELILKEVHHRMKNNMNTISSLLAIQASTLADPQAKKALNDAWSRIQSMMILYDKLYQSSTFAEISLKEYLLPLVEQIIGNFPNSGIVKIESKIDKLILGIQKLQPLGIIINELITNIMKYAFIGRNSGIISLVASEKNNGVFLTIQDNGNGIPEGIDFQKSTGFGLTLVGMLIQQIEGSIRIERGNGTKIIIEFDK